MTVRRMPLAVFAARGTATNAFAEISAEIQTRFLRRERESSSQRDKWGHMLCGIESLIARLDGPAESARIPSRSHYTYNLLNP